VHMYMDCATAEKSDRKHVTRTTVTANRSRSLTLADTKGHEGSFCEVNEGHCHSQHPLEHRYRASFSICVLVEFGPQVSCCTPMRDKAAVVSRVVMEVDRLWLTDGQNVCNALEDTP